MELVERMGMASGLGRGEGEGWGARAAMAGVDSGF